MRLRLRFKGFLRMRPNIILHTTGQGSSQFGAMLIGMRTVLTYSGTLACCLYLWSIAGIAKTRPAFPRIRIGCHAAFMATIATTVLQGADMYRDSSWWLSGIYVVLTAILIYGWRQSFVLIGGFEQLHRNIKADSPQ